MARRSGVGTATAVIAVATAATTVLGGVPLVAAPTPVLPSGSEGNSRLTTGGGSEALIGPPATVAPAVDALEQIDAAALVKAAGLANKQAKAQQQAAELACPPNTAGFGPVKPWVATAGYYLRCKFDVSTIIGVASRAGASDHPLGLALDLMVDRATGDALADCALRNKTAMGISYVIWRQRINYGEGWEAMEDRGDPTQNHMDHVHISFAPAGGGGSPRCDGTST